MSLTAGSEAYSCAKRALHNLRGTVDIFCLWEESLLKGTICMAESSGLLTEPGRWGTPHTLERPVPSRDEEVIEKGWLSQQVLINPRA